MACNRIQILSLITLCISIGCDSRVEERTAGVVDFSDPSVRKIELHSTGKATERDSREGPIYEGSILQIERDLVVGVEMDGPDWQLFSGYPHLLVAPDSSMIIGDSRTHDFNLVDYDGSLIKRFGGAGEGPGEFRQVRNTLWIDYFNSHNPGGYFCL